MNATARFAALVIVAIGLGACGDDAESDPVTTVPAATSTSTSEPATSTTGTATLFEVTSPDFADGDPIPTEFTCDGANARPELTWSGPPDHETIAVVVDDPDAPGGSFIHWIAWGFSGPSGSISGTELGAAVVQAPNSINQAVWIGPCPPSGVHRYVFHFYALSAVPEVGEDPAATWAAIRELSIQEATLTGTYERPAA